MKGLLGRAVDDEGGDWTSRLRRGDIGADPGMRLEPPEADPAMPHVLPGEANPARHEYGVEPVVQLRLLRALRALGAI